MLPAKLQFKQLQVMWYSVINSIIHQQWSGKCYCLLPKYLYLTCTWLKKVLDVLDVFQVLGVLELVLVLANMKKYLYLTQVLQKVLDPNPGWESQRGSDIQSTHIHFVPCESGIPFLSCDFFKICPWKSRAKVMRQVTLRSHNVSLRSYRLTSLSFHVNRASHSWVTTLSKFDLENQVSRSWVRSHFKVTLWV